MKKKFLEQEIKREVNLMMPKNMVADIKAQDVKRERVINKNISVIKEKNRHSIIPIIASCVASIVIALAVFLPIAIKSNEDYANWLQQQQEQQLEDVVETEEE